jgi:hypothetical protein
VHRAYRQSTRLFGVVICGIGLAMVVSTVARGGGPLALGVILGGSFMLIGAGRLYLASER